MKKIVKRLICLIFGHKMGFEVIDHGEGTGIGYGKRYKDTYVCKRCGK
jgi:hypothetical protein